MANEHLPYMPFPEHGPHVARITPLGQEPDGWDQYEPVTEGRIVRVREMPRAEADALLESWRTGGAVELESAAGVHALERSRGDTATGLPRLQRVAVSAGDPARVLNWSAISPVSRDDTAAWLAGLEGLPGPSTGDPRPPTPGLGWTA